MRINAVKPGMDGAYSYSSPAAKEPVLLVALVKLQYQKCK